MSDRIGNYTYNDASPNPNYSVNAPLEPMQFMGASAPGNDTNHNVSGLPSLQIFNGQGHDASTIASMGNATTSSDLSNSLGTMNPQHLGSTEGSDTTNGDRKASPVAHGENLGLNNGGDLIAGGLVLSDFGQAARIDPAFGWGATGIALYGAYNQWRHHSPSTPADNMMIGGSLVSFLGSGLRIGACVSPIFKPLSSAVMVAGTVLEGVGIAKRIDEVEHHQTDK